MRVIREPDKTLSRILPDMTPCPGIVYIPSQFIQRFTHKNTNYVFNTLTKCCIEGVLPESAKAGEGYDELITHRFLVPTDKDECVFYNSLSAMVRALHKKKGIKTFTIMPTLGCNARCIYCYEEGMQKNAMTPETVDQTIRFILENKQDNEVVLDWFGGEPLLCRDIIDRVCREMQNSGVDYSSSMISNGSLIDSEIVDRMTGLWKLKHIQISMDGSESDYIARKRYYDYQEYYKKIMSAVSLMSESGISVTIRCNVDDENWEHIPVFLDDLRNNVRNKERVSLYFCPLNHVRFGDNDVSLWGRIRKAYPDIRNAGLSARDISCTRDGFRINHCMADTNCVVIAPDGKLYPCEHCPPESCYGDIWNGTTNEKAKNDFCRTDRTREKCRKCQFLPHCTSFENCPVEDKHCREVIQLTTIESLKRMVDRINQPTDDDLKPIC